MCRLQPPPGVCPENDAQTILIDPMGFVKLIQQLINPNRLKARLRLPDVGRVIHDHDRKHRAYGKRDGGENPSSIPTRVDSATTSAVWALGMPPEVAMVAKRSFFVLIQAMIVLIA